MNTTQPQVRYDYKNQCWIIDDVIQDCSHPVAGGRYTDEYGELHIFAGCNCYGRAHAGEKAAL